jgi:hypothetical protein
MRHVCNDETTLMTCVRCISGLQAARFPVFSVLGFRHSSVAWFLGGDILAEALVKASLGVLGLGMAL